MATATWCEKIPARCIGEEPPPCQAACPLDIPVREKLARLQAGDWSGALTAVLSRCPFPGILGRICHRPCEAACTRAPVDAAVAIAALKRSLADREPKAALAAPFGTPRPEPMAVVGGGPAGLMAACELARLGYPVTLFEAADALGGALRLYLPAFRLPREVLDREVGLLARLGVEVRLRTRLGRDVHLEDLRRDFAAVFLALGAHKSLPLRAPGAELPGVMDGLSFLKAFNAGRPPAVVGKRVAVIGGGNVAVDAARVARRGGAQDVLLFYRRTRELMPALPGEVEEARAEGVRFHFLTMPVRLLGETCVQGLALQKTELGEPDPDGRLCPLPLPDSHFTVDVDLVIPALGQTADFSCFGEVPAVEDGAIYRLEADPLTLQTRIPGVFAGGDLVTGPGVAVEAFAAGRRAAFAIHHFLTGEGPPFAIPPPGPRATNLIVDAGGLSPTPRSAMPTLAPAARLDSPGAEVEPGLTPAQAALEAGRCLLCVCSRCVSNCTYLQAVVDDFPATEQGLVRRLADLSPEEPPLLPYLCHLCGLCQAVCPQDLYAGGACLEVRQSLVDQGRGPLPRHRGIRNFVRWGTSPTFTLAAPDPATGTAQRVFFPGCSLPGHHPHLVQAAYGYLRSRLPGAGIVLNCCGAPSHFLGERRVFQQVLDGLRRELEHLGAGEIVAACTHCLQIFQEFLPDLPARSLYEMLLEVGPPLPGPAGGGRVFNVHDACGARRMPPVQEAVRRLLLNAGHRLEEMPHHRERTICCGAGGMAPAVDPSLAARMTAFRLSEANHDLVTYCASCRAMFARAGRRSVHVLALLFNPRWPEAAGTRPAGSLRRWWRRWRLKRNLQARRG